MHDPIPVFVINLKNRIDRKQHIINEFLCKNEFTVNIVEPFHHDIGAISLWNTIKYILRENISSKFDYLILCEDDHLFTSNYSKELLISCITEAIKLRADVLCGGVSWFEDAIYISEQICWVKKFSGLQFTIFFKSFFKKIIESDFNENDVADYKISSLSKKIFVIHPFISKQKEFGYSDVTFENNGTKRVEELFIESSESVEVLKKVTKHYYNIQIQDDKLNSYDFNRITIPTYIIYKPDEFLNPIKKQFKGKSEFDLTFIELCKYEINSKVFWLTLKKIITLALKNKDDVIIICKPTHRFANNYSKNFILKNILEAHQQGGDILLGGIDGSIDMSILISENRFWIKSYSKTSFLILYKSVFQKILKESFDGSLNADNVLSEITSNKMVLFPFISKQKKIGFAAFERSIQDNTYKRLNTLKTAQKDLLIRN